MSDGWLRQVSLGNNSALNSLFPKYGVQYIFESNLGCMLGHRFWSMKSLEQ